MTGTVRIGINQNCIDTTTQFTHSGVNIIQHNPYTQQFAQGMSLDICDIII
jgi:hypothetical protein